jgi:uncharacterized protein YdhG (YjbR/CyaY superfamily)
MANTNYKSVSGYIAAQPASSRAVLAQVRAVIRKALPKAEEGISYQIPAYKLPEGVALYFAGWKEHFSLYPATGSVATELGDELSGYIVSKGTIRFPLSDPVPVRLITRIAKLRAKDVVAKAKERSKSKRPTKAIAKPKSTSKARPRATTKTLKARPKKR